MTGRLPGISVVITGHDLVDAAYLVTMAMRTMAKRDCVPPSDRARRLALVLRDAAEAYLAADPGTSAAAELPAEPEPPIWEAADMITTQEAAQMLSLSDRQVRNLADRLGARRAGRALLFDRVVIEAEVIDRAPKADETDR